MSVAAPPAPRTQEPAPKLRPRRKSRATMAAHGEPFVWLTGGALAFALTMTVVLIGYIIVSGSTTFRPLRAVEVTTTGGAKLLGEVVDEERFRPGNDVLEKLDPAAAAAAQQEMAASDGTLRRRKFRTGNFDLSRTHFTWVNDCEITLGSEQQPADAVLIERREWGRFYGFTEAYELRTRREPTAAEQQWKAGLVLMEAQPAADAAVVTAVRAAYDEERRRSVEAFVKEHPAPDGAKTSIVGADGSTHPWDDKAAQVDVASLVSRWDDSEAAWNKLNEELAPVRDRLARRKHLEEVETGRLNDQENNVLVALRSEAMKHGLDLSLHLQEVKQARDAGRARQSQLDETTQFVELCRNRFGNDAPATKAAATALTTIAAKRSADVVARKSHDEALAAHEAQLPLPVRERLKDYYAVQARNVDIYADLQQQTDELSRENQRHRWLLCTAGGVTKDLALDDVVRTYRPNRLSTASAAGVYLSRWREFLFDEPRESNLEGGVWPAIVGTVVMTLFMSLAVVPFGVVAALYLREYAKPGVIVSAVRIAINNLAGVPSIVFGVFGLGFFCYFAGSSIDHLFYPAESATSPVFGKGTVLWASLTLALMTMPVVIVATEEALAAVANSMREGSYACGASKFQTIRRIVLPRALPGIMTGMILAMARGAGEVAPLMLVGALKNAPKLPIDASFPFVHFDRSFMHLGFYIFDLGFQSPNSEAAKPMVFTTALLLITIVVVLNVAAIMIRSRLRRRFQATQF